MVLPFAPPGKASLADWLMPSLLLLRGLLLRDARALAGVVLASGLVATAALALLASLSSLRAAGAIAPRALAADAWVSARATACFTAPVPLAEADLAAIAAALPGASLRRVVVGPARLDPPASARVALLGADGLHATGFFADRGSLARLGLSQPGAPLRLGGHVTVLRSATTGLATPPGPPLLLGGFEEARALLGLAPATLHHVAIDFPAGPPADLAQRLARVEARLPHVIARPQAAMLAASRGCGPRAAVPLLACVVTALLLGGALVVGALGWAGRQARDLARLALHGASAGQLRLVRLALISLPVAGGLVVALLLAPLLMGRLQPLLPWAALASADLLAALAIALCALPIALGIAGRTPDAAVRP